MNKTYLLEGVEVVFTGRHAIRKKSNDRTSELFEVTPANKEQGSYTKWVRKVDLYEIVEAPE